jgi:hypothetical protein
MFDGWPRFLRGGPWIGTVAMSARCEFGAEYGPRVALGGELRVAVNEAEIASEADAAD